MFLPRRLAVLLLFVLVTAPAGATARWSELLPTSIRTGAAFDPGRHWMILPGPTSWVLDLSNEPAYWTPLPVVGTPPPDLQDAMVAFDPGMDAVILFAAENSSPSQAIWILHLGNPAEWTHLDPSSPPPARDLPTTAYDASAHRILRFGGRIPGSSGSLSYKNDLWQTSVLGASAAWSFVPTQGAPGGREDATAAYDTLHQRLLLFGGHGPDPGYSYVDFFDSWELTFPNAMWKPQATTQLPPDGYFGYHNYRSFYDEPRDGLVVVWSGLWEDSVRTDVWNLSTGASPTWLKVYDSHDGGEFTRYDARIAFDPLQRRLLFHGGTRSRSFYPTGGWNEQRTDTWQLTIEPTETSRVPGAGEIPSPRSGATLTYDPAGRRFFLVGGMSSSSRSLGDTWVLDLSTSPAWSDVTSGTLPSRYLHTTVYDSARDRLLVFGGYSTPPTVTQNDVWELGTNPISSWSPIVPSGTLPSARAGHTAIYDPLGDRMIVFGDGAQVPDTWALFFSPTPTWAQILGPGPPALGNTGSTVFDPTPGRMILLSGGVWGLSLQGPPVWTEYQPSGSGYGIQAAYDSVADRAIRFETNPGSLHRVLENTLGEPPSGSLEVPVDGGSPPVRPYPALGFDPRSRSLYVFGGSSSTGSTTATDQTLWRLDLDPAPSPSIRLVDALSDPHHARVTWQVQDAVGSGARVDRREDGGGWQRLGTVPSDLSGFITIDDSTVAAFTKYTYRAAVPTTKGEITGGEVAVAIPGAGGGGGSHLQLYGPRTNPTSEGLVVFFSLPAAAPAHLELLDLRGRAAASMDVTGLGPGTHSVRISPDQPVRSGVYFLRLTQGASESRQKVVLIEHP
jgi:hypothetical protein